MPEQVRHGDLLLEKRSDLTPEEIAENATPRQDGVLAFGEATGHSHQVEGGQVLETEDGSRYAIVGEESEAQVTHEEHDTIELDAGVYEVNNQQEWDIETGDQRRVVD